MQPEGTFSESFLEKLPNVKWNLIMSMQQNEMFILGMPTEEIDNAFSKNDYRLISDKLYRIQKLAEINYMFRQHLETQLIDDANAKTSKRFINVRSLGSLFSLNPTKVKIDCIGNITKCE